MTPLPALLSRVSPLPWNGLHSQPKLGQFNDLVRMSLSGYEPLSSSIHERAQDWSDLNNGNMQWWWVDVIISLSRVRLTDSSMTGFCLFFWLFFFTNEDKRTWCLEAVIMDVFHCRLFSFDRTHCQYFYWIAEPRKPRHIVVGILLLYCLQTEIDVLEV